MRKNILIWLFIIASACGQPLANQKKNDQKNSDVPAQLISVKDMQVDLSILWSAIKEMHPAYGIYTPTDSLQTVYETTRQSLSVPLGESDFVSRVYPLLSALRCGHTQLKHSAGYKNPGSAHLPFEVLVQGNRASVTFHQTASLNTGDEIISINDTAVNSIIAHGADLYAGDGYNLTFKELFLSQYDGFEDACNKYYHWAPPYQVKFRAKDGNIKTILVEAVASNTPQAVEISQTDNFAGWQEAKDTAHSLLRFSKDVSTAWFEVRSYQYNDTVIFENAFKQIHANGVKRLVIDLRHNTGGDIRIASKLLSYLADAPYRIISDLKSRISNPAINHFEAYFDTAGTASFNAGFVPGKQEGAYYHINTRPAFGNLLGLMPLCERDHFNGSLFVLIDGATFSAGAHTAIAIKEYCKKAVFIGRETAGGSDGCSGGTIQHLTLPNTGVVVEFPWMRVVSVAKKPVFGHGVIPDYRVLYEPEDIVKGTDLDIKKVLNMVNK